MRPPIIAPPVVTVPPAELPLSIQRVVSNSRLDDEYDALDIHYRIAEATNHVEELTGRALIVRTVEWYLDEFKDELETPLGVLKEVLEISYVDTDGATQVLDSSKYRVDVAGGRITPAYGEHWPTIRPVTSSIKVTLKVGYGAARDIPHSIIRALLILVSHWHEYREEIVVGASVSPAGRTVSSLLGSFRLQ